MQTKLLNLQLHTCAFTFVYIRGSYTYIRMRVLCAHALICRLTGNPRCQKNCVDMTRYLVALTPEATIAIRTKIRKLCLDSNNQWPYVCVLRLHEPNLNVSEGRSYRNKTAAMLTYPCTLVPIHCELRVGRALATKYNYKLGHKFILCSHLLHISIVEQHQVH